MLYIASFNQNILFCTFFSFFQLCSIYIIMTDEKYIMLQGWKNVAVMLHRSASSRRRRASPSVANSSQLAGVSSTMRGRRASVATEKPLILPPTSPGGTMERQRSPRGSMVPNIALDTENDSPDEVSIYSHMHIYLYLLYISIYSQSVSF